MAEGRVGVGGAALAGWEAVTANYYTGDPLPDLQLPLQQLASLRSLAVVHLTVTARGGGGDKRMERGPAPG